MKRLLVVFAIPLLVISACSKITREETADVLLISQDEVAFPKEGGSATISVACPSEWHSTVSDKSWITAGDDGDCVTITVSANESGSVRNGTVTLESDSGKTEITVSQSWSGVVLSLKINGAEELELDSEGEEFIFTVETNDKWGVSSDADWLSIGTEGNLVKVSAAANGGERREAKITVTASTGGEETSRDIRISQISRGENPYFQMLGDFGLYAERWHYGGNVVDSPGIGTYCTIEQKEYGKTFTIRNLFVDGTEYEASYDKETKRMILTLGSLCLSKEIASLTSTQYWYYYLVQQNFDENKFESGILYGTVGTATDGTSEDCPAILLSGFDEAYGILGLIVRIMPGGQNATLGDVWYADGKMYLVKAEKTDTDINEQ